VRIEIIDRGIFNANAAMDGGGRPRREQVVEVAKFAEESLRNKMAGFGHYPE